MFGLLREAFFMKSFPFIRDNVSRRLRERMRAVCEEECAKYDWHDDADKQIQQILSYNQ